MRKLYSALKYVCIVALVISLIALALVVAYVLINGVDRISLHLIFGEYDPDAPTLLPALIGTLELVAIATVIAVPIGIASAIFLVEYTNHKESFTNDRPVYFSAMIISIIPVIALFIAFSDVIMNNISIGGLKG